MCRSHDQGGTRCKTTDRTRAIAAANRKIARTKAMLAETSDRERKRVLSDRVLTARIELGKARRIKDD